MKIKYVIMAHPSRTPFVEELQRKLRGAEVVWDERDDRWDTGRRSLLAGAEGSDYACVIQDDAILSRNLARNVAALAKHAGDRPVSLYLGSLGSAPPSLRFLLLQADDLDRPWVEAEGPWWGVGVLVRSTLVAELVEWCDLRDDVANYDRRIARWFESKGIRCLYTWPSLVNHRPVRENPSLIEGRTANRQAQRFNEDGRLLDWSRPALTLVDKVSFRHVRNGRTITIKTGTEQFGRILKSPVWAQVEIGAAT